MQSYCTKKRFCAKSCDFTKHFFAIICYCLKQVVCNSASRTSYRNFLLNLEIIMENLSTKIGREAPPKIHIYITAFGKLHISAQRMHKCFILWIFRVFLEILSLYSFAFVWIFGAFFENGAGRCGQTYVATLPVLDVICNMIN